MRKVLVWSFIVSIVLGPHIDRALGAEYHIAKGGAFTQLIIVAENSSEETLVTAHKLAGYLQQIFGGTVEVKRSTLEKGIIVGTTHDYPQFDGVLSVVGLDKPEIYLLRSLEDRLYLIGKTEIGTRHAVFDLLHRIGYRQYFPGKHWEIIPQKKSFSLDVDITEQPDFILRDFFVGHSTSNPPLWPGQKERWEHWREANRLVKVDDAGKAFTLNSGHVLQHVYARNKKTFDTYPEYLALYKGKRGGNEKRAEKYCLSKQAVRNMIAEYTINFFERYPEHDTASIEPSDWDGWCECEECEAMGSPSDRMVILANEVIDKVREKYPNKYLAFYAYNRHAAPPTRQLNPGIIVSVTTGLRRGTSASFEDVATSWIQQGAQSGVRDYASLASYDSNGIPYYSRAGRLMDYIEALKSYKDFGFKYYRTELSDTWGSDGLGLYLASRILWDTSNIERVNQLFEELLSTAFPNSKDVMRKYFELTTGINDTVVSPFNRTSIRELFEVLNEAWNLADEQEKLRIGDLVLYARYLSIYDNYLHADSEGERKKLLEEALRFSYRVYPTHMVNSRALWSGKFDANLIPRNVIPEEVEAGVPAEENPWKEATPFTLAEIESILSAGAWREKVPVPVYKLTPHRQQSINNRQIRSTLRTRGDNSILIYALSGGEITIRANRFQDGFFDYPRNFEVTNAAGERVVVSDNTTGNTVKIQAQRGEYYKLFLHQSRYVGTYQIEIIGAPAAVRADTYLGNLMQYQDSTRLYVYTPNNSGQWNFYIRTGGKGETVKVKVRDPQERLADEFESGEKFEFDRSYENQKGFWEISLSKASTGIPYKRLMRFSGSASPWVSITPGYLLQVDEIE